MVSFEMTNRCDSKGEDWQVNKNMFGTEKGINSWLSAECYMKIFI